jgi:acyl-[acyl-carrier-protein] desaturase
MREVEMTTQHLISDGLHWKEEIPKKFRLYKFSGACDICFIIEWPKWLRNMEIINCLRCVRFAGEMRHHHAYSEFVSAIFKVDPKMMIFQYMMKQKM